MEILKFDNAAPQKRTRQKKSSTKGLVAAAGFAAIAEAEKAAAEEPKA